MSTPGYPDGYQDPPWDGTGKDFGETVIPARVEALTESLNDHFGGVLPDGMRFGWAPAAGDGPASPGEPGPPDEDEADSDGYAVVTPGQFEDFTRKHGIRWTPQ